MSHPPHICLRDPSVTSKHRLKGSCDSIMFTLIILLFNWETICMHQCWDLLWALLEFCPLWPTHLSSSHMQHTVNSSQASQSTFYCNILSLIKSILLQISKSHHLNHHLNLIRAIQVGHSIYLWTCQRKKMYNPTTATIK